MSEANMTAGAMLIGRTFLAKECPLPNPSAWTHLMSFETRTEAVPMSTIPLPTI